MRAPRAAKRALGAGAIRRFVRWPRGRAGAAVGAGWEVGAGAVSDGAPAGGLAVPGSIPPPVPGGAAPRVRSAGPSAARELGGILGEVERLRPGTVRRRALDFGCGSGAFTAALGAEFEECDGVDTSETSVRAARLTGGAGTNCRFRVVPADGSTPFDDEVFDFVRCAPLPADIEPGHAARTIAEVIRVLRLLGVAVIDCAGAPSEPDGVNSAVWKGIHLSAPARLDLGAGAEAQLEVTLANRGRSMWPGSALDELRLEWSWQSEGQPLLAVPEIILQGSLVPGDSMIVRVTLHASPAAGSYPGRLALRLIEPGGSVRALPALPVTVTVHAAEPSERVAGPSISEAIEAAGGAILATTAFDSEWGEPAGVRYFVGKS